MNICDIIFIGGGQSALSCAYFLRRKGLDYLILDDQDRNWWSVAEHLGFADLVFSI